MKFSERWCIGFLLMLTSACAMAQNGWKPMQFSLQLEPQFTGETIFGTLHMQFVVEDRAVSELVLDAGNLVISDVQLDRENVPFEKQGNKLRVRLRANRPAGTLQQLQVRYTGEASEGLRYDKDAEQVSTAFSTSQWMPCLDDPSIRAAFNLTLRLPVDHLSIANGAPDIEKPQPDGKVLHAWRMSLPMPSYLYGFAAGRFTRTQASAGNTALQYFGPAAVFDAAALQQVFADSADMLAYFTEKAGVAYPFPAYRQVLLLGPAAQEMAGFSVMGVRYGTRVLADPQAIWLGAHEMAHQWWGNGVTNKSWRHFWLNEGIATFMTAAYLEHRFGPAEYQKQMDAARVKYLALRDAGLDKSLVFPDWDRPTSADRSLVYDKGALVVHELRIRLGEESFWKGLKHYTQKYWAQPVETADFIRAMEQSSGVDLSAFFKQWVDAK